MMKMSMKSKSPAPVLSTSSEPFSPNWRNISFVIPLHLLGLLAWPIYVLMGGSISWVEVSLFFFMYALGAFGICAGYHRGFTHRAFTMKPLVKYFGLFAGASAGEGSALSWCSDHRRHHLHEDTPLDPYNVKRGFWWAHMGWLLGSPTSTDFSNCKDLSQDAAFQHQHKFYILWFLASSFLLPTLLGALFGRAWEAFLLAGFTRLMLLNHATFCINSWAHYFGRQNYSTKITARDSLLLAIFAWGEGWHNYHHRFPFDYRNGPKATHWDPGKWMIYGLSKMGLVSDLKVTPEFEILKARMEVLKERAAQTAKSPKQEALEHRMAELYQTWRKSYIEWVQLKKNWKQERSEDITRLREQMKEARAEFRRNYAILKSILRSGAQTA